MTSTRLQQRSEDTRNALMRAAEQLIADRGIENVTARAITALAGQKNESALQYHFGSFSGLIQAIGAQRNAQVEERRRQLLDKLHDGNPNPSLRDICRLMIGPAYELSREDPGFLMYVKGFGRELALSDAPAFRQVSRRGNRATLETRRLLFEALSHIGEDVVRDRFDHTIRFIGLSMSRYARTKGAFHGKSAEQFFNRLVDMTAGLFSADVSSPGLASGP